METSNKTIVIKQQGDGQSIETTPEETDSAEKDFKSATSNRSREVGETGVCHTK
jgi:hypothetical protein